MNQVTTIDSPQTLPARFFLFLFGLPFAGVAIFMGLWVAYDAQKHSERKNWLETPAKILSVELKTHQSSKGGSTYSVKAQFQYTIEGNTYEGNKVSAYSTSDNIGQFHQRIYKELKKYQETQQEFRCYVNPSNFSEAILYRDYRLEMVLFQLIFVVVFGLVGFLIIAVALFGSTNLDRLYKKRHPQEPWLHKKEWFEGRIRSSNKAEFIFLFIFSFIWNAISFPIFFLVYQDIAKHPHGIIYFVGIFPLFGILMICSLIYRFFQWTKYGESVFEMASIPGEIGGELRGTLYPSCPLTLQEHIDVSLRCIETKRTVKRSAGKTETQIEKKTLWTESLQISQEPGQEQTLLTEIPVVLSIPDHLPETSGNSSLGIHWMLQVSAAVFGVDYEAKFEVPIFKVPNAPKKIQKTPTPSEKTNPSFLRSSKTQDLYLISEEELHLQTALNGLGIKSDTLSAGAIRFVFPPLRHLSSAYPTFFLSAFLFILFVLLIVLQTSPALLVTALFFALWPLTASLNKLLYKSQITVEPKRIQFSGGFLGMGSLQEVPLADILSITLQPENQSGSRSIHRIELATHSQETYILARFLESKHYCLRFITELNHILYQKKP